MQEKNLVICVGSFSYGEKLGENISRREELAVKVHICTDFENVMKVSERKKIHILVTDEQLSKEEREAVPALLTVLLTRQGDTDSSDGEVLLFKYQSADEIIRQIFEAYAEATKENIIKNFPFKEMQITAVYSPAQSPEKTAFSMALGKEYAKKSRTLYINMEEYSALPVEADTALNLADLLYYFKQGKGNLGIHLQSAVREEEELRIISPVSMAADLKGISPEEWQEFLGEIRDYTEYDRLILEPGESVQGITELLESCDRIYMPVPPDSFSRNRLARFEQAIGRMGRQRTEQITHTFEIPDNIEEYARMRAKEEY